MTINYSDLQEALQEINTELKDLTNSLFETDSWKSYAEVEVNTWGNKPIEAQVNWSCLGQVTPEEATKMATLLTEAAERARNFKYNSYTVTF